MSFLSDFLGVSETVGTYASYEYDTSGIFTFNVPAGVTLVYVTGCAAGGGGGSGATDGPHTYSRAAGGGGSGEHVFHAMIKVGVEEAITVTIGAGGAGGGDPGTGHIWGINGTDGGDVTFGDYLILKGGKGGGRGYSTDSNYNSSTGYGGNGGGLTGHTGDNNIMPMPEVPAYNGRTIGGAGGGAGRGYGGASASDGGCVAGSYFSSVISYASTERGGGGADSCYGSGGEGGISPYWYGYDATGNGAGGGGGHSRNNGASTYFGVGGDGTDGYLLIEWVVLEA